MGALGGGRLVGRGYSLSYPATLVPVVESDSGHVQWSKRLPAVSDTKFIFFVRFCCRCCCLFDFRSSSILLAACWRKPSVPISAVYIADVQRWHLGSLPSWWMMMNNSPLCNSGSNANHHFRLIAGRRRHAMRSVTKSRNMPTQLSSEAVNCELSCSCNWALVAIMRPTSPRVLLSTNQTTSCSGG